MFNFQSTKILACNRHRWSIIVWPSDRQILLVSFLLNKRAHFCLSRFKVDEMSKTRMAQSRKICRFWLFDRPVLTIWPAGFKYQTVLMVTDQDFMNRDEIKRDKNGQNMFVRRCLLLKYIFMTLARDWMFKFLNQSECLKISAAQICAKISIKDRAQN